MHYSRETLASVSMVAGIQGPSHTFGLMNPGERASCRSGQRLAIASRTAGTTSFAHRFSVVSLMMSPGGTM